MSKCKIGGCENDISPNSKLDICSNCRSGLSYWNRKRPAQVLHRRERLTVFSSRINTLIKKKDL